MKANKKWTLLIVTILVSWLSPYLFAHTEIGEDEVDMFIAMTERDEESFVQLLSSGADPLAPTAYSGFRSSVLCESTKLHNEEFFDLIVDENISLDYQSEIAYAFSSPLNCAIFYGNYSVYKKLLDLGADVNVLENPDVRQKQLYRYPLNNSLKLNRTKFAWDIINRIEVRDVQLEDIVVFVYSNFESQEAKNDRHFQLILNWLLAQGIEMKPGVFPDWRPPNY